MIKRRPGKPPQLRTAVITALKDERLTPKQRMEYVFMLAEIDGFEFKYKQAKTVEELPTEEDIFSKNSEARIKAALNGVKEESHGTDASADTSS